MSNLTIDSEIEVKPDLKKLSLDELRQLKEQIGNEVYKNSTSIINDRLKTVKRKNKNRPSEISSKIDTSLNPIKKVKLHEKPVEKITKRVDPRFDSLYGEFDKRIFERNYKFLNDVKEKEKKKLKKKLKKNAPDEKKEQIKLLLQRMDNQDREKEKLESQEKIKSKLKYERLEALKEGKKPQFLKKSESKIMQLVGQYEDLKSKGKLKKHIKQKRIRVTRNEKKNHI